MKKLAIPVSDYYNLRKPGGEEQVTEQDRRILNFLLSHGLMSAEQLKKELRLQIALEAERMGDSTAEKRNTPSRWSLHREQHFPRHLSDSAFLLTARN
jgi:hypothetical protein